MPRLEIFDRNDAGTLNISLGDILNLVSDKWQHSRWFILELEGRAVSSSDLDILSLESSIGEKECGTEFSWEELNLFARDLFDVTDISLVGLKSPSQAPCKPFNAIEYREYIWFEVIDSSLWVCDSDIPEVIDAVKNRYRDIRTSSS